MIRASLVIITIASLSFTGCKGKDKEGGGGGGGDKPAAAKGPTKLPKTGLQADIPAEEIRVSDGLTPTSDMVNTVAMGGLVVEVAETAQTLDEVKADAEMFTPKNLKTETLPDGFAVTFENTGSMGTNYWVDVRRTIDGKNIKCSSTGNEAGKAAAALAACKSLRK
jgi:hypothetical protein